MFHDRDLRRLPGLLLGLLALAGLEPGGIQGAVLQDVPERIVAIGDLHGDLEAAKAALTLAEAIDQEGNWIGGELVVVQLGDILDRGDQEEEVMALFEDLIVPAHEAGGAVYLLNGNHEFMNADGDFRYVTTKGLSSFPTLAETNPTDAAFSHLPPYQRHRAAVFSPGGNGARFLARKETARIVGNTVFVHGGLLPEHVAMGLERMNAEARRWLLGELDSIPEWMVGERSPVWTRLYSDAPNLAACDTLSSVLDSLGVKRMVVGHTPQAEGVTAYCGGLVWCIDTGMAAYYKGFPEVLEIKGDVVRSLRARILRQAGPTRDPNLPPLLRSYGPFPKEQPPSRPPLRSP